MLNVDFTYPELKEATAQAAQRKVTYDEPLSIVQYDNAIVLPAIVDQHGWNVGGIIDPNTGFVSGSGRNFGMETSYDYSPSDLIEDSSEALYIGHLELAYGHAITDGLKSLWFIHDKQYKNTPNKPKLIYTLDGEPTPWLFELMNLVGIDLHKCQHITTPTRFKKLFFPQPSYRNANAYDEKLGHQYTPQFSETISIIIANAMKKASKGTYPKLYFSRAGNGRLRDDYGEQAIETILRKQGFHIIRPQDHSITQQIALLQGCKTFVATEGSVSHNSLFTQLGTNVIILRKACRINNCTLAIDSIRESQTTIIDCHLSTLNQKGIYASGGPFFIYPTDQFCSFLGIKRQMFPWNTYRNYQSNIWRYEDIAGRVTSVPVYTRIFDHEIKNTFQRIETKLSFFQRLSTAFPCLHNFFDRLYRYLRRKIFCWTIR